MKKIKILVGIPNFGSHQDNYLEKVLYEYEKFKEIEPTVCVCHTESYTGKSPSFVKFKSFPSSIKNMLSGYPRALAYNEIDDFDLFMHQENDTLITEDHILTFIEAQEELDYAYGKNNFIHGFIRYEINEEGKWLIDLHAGYTGKDHVHYGCSLDENGLYKFDNIHQGGWLLNRSQLKKVREAIKIYGESLEDYCSNFYYANKWPGSVGGIRKRIDKKFINKSLIHHLPNKYVARKTSLNNFMKYPEGVPSLGQ